MNKPNIKAVTFDLWETIILERNGWSSKRMNVRCNNLAIEFNKFGIKTSKRQIRLAFTKMFSWLTDIWNTNKEVTHQDQIEFIIKSVLKNSLAVNRNLIYQLSPAYTSAIFEVPPDLNPDAPKVLNWLKEQNKKVGLISNTGLTPGFGLREFLTKKNMAKYFDLMLFSDEIHVRKPDPRIFHIAAEKLQVNPHQIVHIGDNLKSDIQGSKNAEFQTIYLTTETGKDIISESDPNSLVSISRIFNSLEEDQIIPDMIIQSLGMAIEAIKKLEASGY
ncbi:MAG: HAD family hydrolase [Candidatus Bathyarchaeota archaeon]|jgi:putative hydrolase of the HAD superfamily